MNLKTKNKQPPKKTDASTPPLVVSRNNERYGKIKGSQGFDHQKHRQNLYHLQGKSSDILASVFVKKDGIKKHAHRVVQCTKCRVSAENGVFVYVNKETGRAQYGNLMLCGSVWTCPKCANRITTARSAEVLQAIQKAPAFGFLTLTTPHHLGTPLPKLLKMQALAKEAFYRSHRVRNLLKMLGVHGRITATECTWGEVNGWHPHYHALLFLDKPVQNPLPSNYESTYQGKLAPMPRYWTPAPCRNRFCFGKPKWRKGWGHQQFYTHEKFLPMVRDALAHQWVNACHDVGMNNLPDIKHGLDLQAITDENAMKKLAEYMTKYGCMPQGERINTELTKWHTKTTHRQQGEILTGVTPFEILAMADPSNPNCPYCKLWREFANAFKGKRQLDWSPNLKKMYGIGEVSDDEIINETEENAEKVFEITYTIWRLILQRNERIKPLELAEQDFLDGGGRLYNYCIDVLMEHLQLHQQKGVTPNRYIIDEINRLLGNDELDQVA